MRVDIFEIKREGALVLVRVVGECSKPIPPSEARQLANALLVTADECEGRLS